MEKILFIHGLASDRNSTTGKRVKEILSDYGEVICENFNPQDIDEMLDKLHKKINDEGFTMLVGHSFGGFWTLIANTIPKKLNKIVINPCYYPSIEIPKLTEVDSNFVKDFEEQEKLLDITCMRDKGLQNFGIFGDADPLFSYENEYLSLFGNIGNTVKVPGEHKISKTKLETGLMKALEYFGIKPVCKN